MGEFGYRNYHRQLSAVLQDDTLFTGTLSDNICMFEAEPSEERIRHVAELVGIAHDIEAMPLKYRTLIGDMGSSLSSGQRQRILIARTLYREPSFIVMDEATSHLDAECEKIIACNLDNLEVTRITVAHREETLRHASARYRFAGSGRVREARHGANEEHMSWEASTISATGLGIERDRQLWPSGCCDATSRRASPLSHIGAFRAWGLRVDAWPLRGCPCCRQGRMGRDPRLATQVQGRRPERDAAANALCRDRRSAGQ
ncbi:ATP-binding cassette domain-containing protein [Sphingomonas oligophenolica]|uniref:ATP-binding cassette domain-containing protein n=1 Tax=Sphingomonas oligophenolica TaxID=301154 RepID=A0ABU9Y0T2_9SPHN